MSLYHQYRPNEFSQIKGNSDIISSLEGMFSNKDKEIPHAFLFHGQTGCGKTTIARIIRNILEVSELDYKEIDSAQFNGIEMVRELRKNCQFKPVKSKYRVYVLDEVHMLSTAAQEGMLKILEDTPKYVVFILCTTDPKKLKPTIRGRCSQFQVNPLEDREMKKLLKSVVKKEKDVLEQEVYDQIILDSLGLPRNALQILEQVLNAPKKRRLKIAKQAAIQQSASIELCKTLLANSSWNKVKEILKGLQQQDPEGIRRHVLGYAKSVLLGRDVEKAAIILEEFMEPTYNSGFPQIVLACYSVIKNS